MGIPEGWTDNMNIPVPQGRTVEEIADYVIRAALRGTPDATTEQLVATEFLLSPEDAAVGREIERAAESCGPPCAIRELPEAGKGSISMGALPTGHAGSVDCCTNLSAKPFWTKTSVVAVLVAWDSRRRSCACRSQPSPLRGG